MLKLGFLADFLSRSVLIGFLTGVGIQVSCGQIAGMLGVEKTGRGPIAQAINAILAIPAGERSDGRGIGGGANRHRRRRDAQQEDPGPAHRGRRLDHRQRVARPGGDGRVDSGHLPSGLPTFGLPAMPTAAQWGALVATAGSLFLVILAQSAATSRAYATKYADRFDENVDLVGLSLSNVAAGLSGTFVVNGSPTKTEMVDEAGGRSQISQLTTSVIVLLVLLFFTTALSYMPNCVLSTVVFIIGVKLVDIKGMRSIFAQRRAEFWLASLTAAIVVVVGVEQGIILAMLLSILLHMRHSYRPTDLVLVPDGGGVLRLAPLDSGGQVKPGVVAYHFGASLYFANAASFSEEVLKIVADATPPVEVLLFDFSAVGDVDFSSAFMLKILLGTLHDKKIDVLIMNVTPAVSAEMQRSGLTELVGADKIFEDVAGAMTVVEKQDCLDQPASASASGGVKALVVSTRGLEDRARVVE